MLKILKSHYTYLLLFCFGSLLFGFEVSEVLKNGFPTQTQELVLSVSALICYGTLTLYFFLWFYENKKKRLTTTLYFPIQKLAKMFPRSSSELISPVISPK